MNLRVCFELTEEDLKHFRLIMHEARQAAANARPEDIVDAARSLLDKSRGSEVPIFIRDRFDSLDLMIRMLTDHEWRLPAGESARVLNALAYFSEPEDLIPDHIPGLGFLDDAIMIELVRRELQHEIEAYRDFCDFRQRSDTRGGVKARTTDVTRDDWLSARRDELQARMRRRQRGTSGKSRIKLF